MEFNQQVNKQLDPENNQFFMETNHSSSNPDDCQGQHVNLLEGNQQSPSHGIAIPGWNYDPAKKKLVTMANDGWQERWRYEATRMIGTYRDMIWYDMIWYMI